MQSETFIVGGKEYTCARMNPFEANRLLLRIQKVVIPLIGVVAGSSNKSLFELDVKQAAAAIAEHLDETLFDTIVLPMFSEAKLYAAEQKKFIKDATSINQCFTTENLFDLYELVWLVGRFQFEPFFAQLTARFGGALGASKTAPLAPEPLTHS